MNCIIKITDEDFGLKSIPFNNPRIRYGARGLVFNHNKVAILYKEKKNEYKLVGGGIDEGERPEEAFKREVLEETGCIVEIESCLGITEESKSKDNFKQFSYIYIAHVIKDLGNQNLTAQEKAEGSKLLWLEVDEAIKIISNCEEKLLASVYEGDLSIYHTKFIVRRDSSILEFYKNRVQNENNILKY